MRNKFAFTNSERSGNFIFLYALFFVSGTASLMFQVVWMYRLGLVFGNAAYATAATLSAFFLGLALGGRFFGNASARFKRPLRMYGLMELGIALTAFLLAPGLDFYEKYYSDIVSFSGDTKSILLGMKFVFGTSLLFFPSFLMGGTFPVLAQYIGKNRNNLSRRGTILYAVNTLGAALGAFVAAFYLLSKYGVGATYGFAIALAVLVGVLALVLDRWYKSPYPIIDETSKYPVNSKKTTDFAFQLSQNQFIIVAFFSGALALSAETLWTKMFAQVLQNSVYSFAAILVVFLLALGLGGVLSHILVRLGAPSKTLLILLLSTAAVLIGLSPTVFNSATNGLEYLAINASWFTYIWSVFKLSLMVIMPPTIILGAVFPFLLKAAPKIDMPSGSIVGKLVLYNSLGGFVGPVLAGFFLLDIAGLWNSIKIIALLYGILALLIAFPSYRKKKIFFLLWPVVVILGIMVLENPPIVKLENGEKVLDYWQSSDGVVSIVQLPENIEMRLDNFYVLGDSKSFLVEQMQAHVPLMIHPAPKKVVFLGMGTGVTAGAALNHEVEKVIAVELVSNVIPAAKRYFSPWTNGLFKDKRANIVADDARNFLLGTNEQFDVIVGDLFTPWHAGTGSLYTLEHFEQAKKRLSPGGIFAQWLPLYQLTSENFNTIAATFAAVYPQVTLWRADFSTTRASILLVGQEEDTQLDENILRQNIVHVIGEQVDQENNHMAGLFYLGNLEAIRNRLSGVELNTDDRRSVEFRAPILSQQANSGRASYITGKELDTLLTALRSNLPAEEDPYLSNLPMDEIRFVKVGSLYHRYIQYVSAGKEDKAKKIREQIQLLASDFLKTETKAIDEVN
ncbi:fused MFS/spermidine synthase [Maribacter sp.]|uniref:PABS domain-containing protein n=1 Tax=marine sediment metagenome TaxID=412755 RepID=A0A0F9Y9K4_9ZZZZ|nr:fused MFS/spermidine synthase [Maribacter sp.]HDZ07439.1 spermidine synthase [Maribacter sp.]HEA79868.1 spermidine synthase [Maribacter sp.]|tara:strand:+ start:12775 stop:15321 length:2547 start_codon:yes stop_codon:yes gene_type:complete